MFFDVAVSEKLQTVTNIIMFEVETLEMLCFVRVCCCHEDFGVLGGVVAALTIKTSEL